MRPVRIDITGTTDANGAFSQVIRLDKTGEWRNLKVAIGTTAPAEWSLSVSGTPVTYGRGRRVTLGPELLQPFDTLTVACVGGPANTALQGSCAGLAGSEGEILPGYVPAPNTIALDVTAPRVQLWPDGTPAPQRTGASFTVGTNASVSDNFTLPSGILELRIGANASGLNFTWGLQVVGNQSGQVYFPNAAGQVGQPANFFLPVTVAIDPEWDKSVTVTVTNFSLATPINIFVATVAAVEAVEVRNQVPLTITIPTPAPWQAAAASAVLDGSTVANGATLTLVAALAGEFVYVHDVDLKLNAAGNFLLDRSDGTRVAAGQAPSAGLPAIAWDGKGIAGLGNTALRVNNNSGASITVLGTVGYNQQ